MRKSRTISLIICCWRINIVRIVFESKKKGSSRIEIIFSDSFISLWYFEAKYDKYETIESRKIEKMRIFQWKDMHREQNMSEFFDRRENFWKANALDFYKIIFIWLFDWIPCVNAFNHFTWKPFDFSFFYG